MFAELSGEVGGGEKKQVSVRTKHVREKSISPSLTFPDYRATATSTAAAAAALLSYSSFLLPGAAK